MGRYNCLILYLKKLRLQEITKITGFSGGWEEGGGGKDKQLGRYNLPSKSLA